MRGKREKTNELNKSKALLIIICICIIIGIIVFLITDKKDEEQGNVTNSTNITNSITNINEASEEPRIMAYIVKNNKEEVITDGAKFDSNIIVFCNAGKIESITHNNSRLEEKNGETELKEDGTYIIIMKPNNKSSKITTTITIDTAIPTLQIDEETITGNVSIYEVGKKLTLKEGKGSNKFTKAMLVKCNSNGELIKTEEPIDIAKDLKNEGYILNKEGIYKIQLLDENNNQIEFIGKDSAFKIR